MIPALVPTSDVERIWPHVRDHLKRGCARAPETAYRWRLGQIEQMCRSGNAYLIVIYEPDPFAVHMASVWQFEADEFRCQVLGGRNMKAWLGTATAFIAQKAREGEAIRLVAKARTGWRRLFPQARRIGDEMEMDI